MTEVLAMEQASPAPAVTQRPHAVSMQAYRADFDRLASTELSSEPEWLKRFRADAMQSFETLGFPTMKNEDWHFTSVAPIADRVFHPAKPATITGEVFSSLPITFILKFLKATRPDISLLIEGNGGDDCFGFSALATRAKMRVKALCPTFCKAAISGLFQTSDRWRVDSEANFLARVLALADVHEINPLNYFLVLTPVNFLGLTMDRSWDTMLTDLMDGVVSRCTNTDNADSYQAQVTMRQLLHVNSRRWAAKAFSVGESLGIRTVYPYIWRDILIEQGGIPWQAKINNGVVKWPLKRLLEEYMPPDFIYRQKSGIVPPFAQWLTAKDFNQTVRDILLSSQTIIGRIVPS